MSLSELCVLVGEFVKSDYMSTGVVVLLAASFLLEFSGVKVKPWSWTIKKIGKIANSEIEGRLDGIEADINELKTRNDRQDEKNLERDAIIARREILKFGDSLRVGVKYSKESYEQVLVDIDNYEKYCNSHPDFKNNKTLSATKKILSDYESRDLTNDFLK